MDYETHDNIMDELNDALISLDNAASMLEDFNNEGLSDELRRYADRVFEIYGNFRRNY